jgi:hypothetical protein
MNPRNAVKETLRFLIKDMANHRVIFSEEEIEALVEGMHDDIMFLEAIQDFLEDYINDFSENYLD